MFHESLEGAWLDKVDRRYAWLRRTLVTYEEECLPIFPTEWGIPERVTIQFCNSTRYVGCVLSLLPHHLDVPTCTPPPPPLASCLPTNLSPTIFVHLTAYNRESLSQLMKSRAAELDVKLLLFAIQKTTSFEKLLAQRFGNSEYMESVRVVTTM